MADGRSYVGQSVNIDKRLSEHRRLLGKNKHHSPPFQHAWNKYGAGAFSAEILETVDITGLDFAAARDRMCEREQHWMDVLDSSLNASPAAGSNLGVKASDETREKLRVSHLGQVIPQSTIEAVRRAHLGKPKSEEMKAKVSAANRGRKHTPEERAKMSAARMGKPPPNKGKPRSPETREKLREAQTGKKHTEESRAKMCAAQQERRRAERDERDRLLAEGVEPEKRGWSALRRQRFEERQSRLVAEAS